MAQLPDASTAPKGARRFISPVVRGALVIGLLYFLIRNGFISAKETQKAFERWPQTLVGGLIIFSTAIIASIRWQGLLGAQDMKLPFSRTVQLSLIGNFFNLAIPGAVSGDLVKAWYIGRDVEDRRARAFGTILFDRVLGVSGLVIVCAVAMLFGLDVGADAAVLQGLRIFISAAAAGAIGFFAYLFFVRPEHDVLLRIMRAVNARVKKTEGLTEFYLGMRHYHAHPLAVLRALAISIFIHMILGYACLSFGRALGEEQLTLIQTYSAAPIGFLVTTIPVAPVGVGTGHAAFLYLFKLMGSERGADIFTLVALSQMVTGFFGSIIYLRFKAGNAGGPPAIK